jgi:hypothetical protein
MCAVLVSDADVGPEDEDFLVSEEEINDLLTGLVVDIHQPSRVATAIAAGCPLIDDTTRLAHSADDS